MITTPNGTVSEVEQRFRLLADSSPVMLWIAGTNAKCHFFNEGWLRFTGRSMEQEIDDGWVEGVHPQDLQRCMNTYMEEFNARRSFRMEYRLRRHDGEYRWLLDTGIPHIGPGGTFEGYIGSCIDISEIKESEALMLKSWAELEKQVQERTRALESTNKELKEFAHAVSHDLQEPLRKIGSYTEILANRYRGKLDEDADRFIHYIVDGVDRMKGLIHDLLAYSQSNQREIEKEMVSLSVVLDKVLDALQSTLQETGGTVTRGSLPDVLASPLLLGQILQNLLSNALKYRKKEQPSRIRVFAEEKSDHWVVSVCDNGIGIAPEYFDKIFVVFQRLHTLQEYRGTGIGLSICKKLVERHGGRIWVNSTPGKGAAFHFTLPKRKEAS